jgi:hypothetical protein
MHQVLAPRPKTKQLDKQNSSQFTLKDARDEIETRNQRIKCKK